MHAPDQARSQAADFNTSEAFDYGQGTTVLRAPRSSVSDSLVSPHRVRTSRFGGIDNLNRLAYVSLSEDLLDIGVA